MTAWILCPKVTGTLAETIRREPIGYEGTQNEVVQVPLIMSEEGEGIPILQEVLVAGGLLINPITGRICDYAVYVHDGTGTSTNIGPRPFLTEALDSHIDELGQILIDATTEMEKTWTEENGSPSGGSE